MPVEPGIEEDIHPAAGGQVGSDFGEHLFDQLGQCSKRERGEALLAALSIQTLDLLAFEIEAPGEGELHRSELQMQHHIMRSVGALAFLPPDRDMVVVQRDGFQSLGLDIFAAERIVDAEEEQAPAGLSLNLGHAPQQQACDRLPDR